MAEGTTSSREKLVKRLNFSDGNMAIGWKIFKSQFTIYKVAKKFGDMSEEEQIANLLVLMGADSIPIYEQFPSMND